MRDEHTSKKHRVLPVSALPPGSTGEARARFARCRAPLLRWFSVHGRVLPWRLPFVAGTGEGGLAIAGQFPLRPPYATWISEIMLQQTQVATVAPRFTEWMRLFPDVASLAAAPELKVLRAWAGLGYYARARNLRKGAQALHARGAWPSSAREWREIPGVGDYTAGAVSSIAFGRPDPILDGNVIRVFSRLFGLGFLPGDSAAAKGVYWELARLWVDAPRPGALNEGLMELGALVCTPVAPRCDICPLRSACVARAEGWQEILPPPKKRASVESVAAVAVVAAHHSRVLFEERPRGAFLTGHAMFPLFLGDEARDWKAMFRKRFPGTRVLSDVPSGNFRHAIMSKRYEVEVRMVVLSGTARAQEGLWVPTRSLPAILTNSLAKKIWEKAKGRG